MYIWRYKTWSYYIPSNVIYDFVVALEIVLTLSYLPRFSYHKIQNYKKKQIW